MTQDKSVEEVVEEIQEEIDDKNSRKGSGSGSSDKNSRPIINKSSNLAGLILKQIIKSGGFLTSKGKIWSKPEGHAVAIGISTFGLAYLLPTPLGELFVIMFLSFLRTGIKKWARGEKMEGHIGDVIHEWAYAVTFAFITSYYFETQTGYGLSQIDFNQLVLAMLGGP